MDCLTQKIENLRNCKNQSLQGVVKNDYTKGHLHTRLKGLINMIKNMFLLYIRTQPVLICINLNFLARKF